MRSERLCAIEKNGVLTIRIRGPLDLMLTTALRGICQDVDAPYRHYIVDLQNVSVVRDSGLALLIMLKHLTCRRGATLQIINGSAGLMSRCVQLGIKPS